MSLKHIFPLSLLLVVLGARAQTLTESEAQDNVMKFLSSLQGAQARQRQNGKQEISLAYSSAKLYAFDTDGRFVLAAGDASMPPILGYSDACPFEKAMKSDCFRALIQHISADFNPNFRIYKPTDVAEAVGPLCLDTWHQYAPFNLRTPVVDGQHCVVGCVATSMSELMQYYKHPVHGYGSYEYVDTAGCGMTLSADFSSHYYDWDNILDDYGYEGSVDYTDKQGDAVALLASDCGISVDMTYNTVGSGAHMIKQPLALVNHFGYDESMQMYYRNFFTQCEWDSIMFHELDEGRPMLVGGWSQTGAHAYVCDGYDSNGFFHLLLGNPEEDGTGYYYFTWSTPLQPQWYNINEAEGGLNVLQSLLVGVKPKTTQTPSQQHYIYGFARIDALGEDLRLTATVGSPFEVGVYSLCNTGWNEHYGTVGVALKAEGSGKTSKVEETTLLYKYTRHFELEELVDTTYDDTLRLALPADVAEGTYRIVPVYEENGMFVEARTMVGTPNYLRCRVSGGQAEIFSPAEEHSSLRLTQVNFPSVAYLGTRPVWSYTLTNDGAEYSGRLYTCFYNDDEPEKLYNFGRLGVSIDKGETQTYNFSFTYFREIPPGDNYHLKIISDVDLFTDSVIVLYDGRDQNIQLRAGRDPATEIEAISADTDAQPEVIATYDLAGRRITNPANLTKGSVYIEVMSDQTRRKKMRVCQNR